MSPTALRFRGARALSEFRLAKLLQRLKEAQPSIRGVAAEYWHFVDAGSALGEGQVKLLERLLRYGIPATGEAPGALCLVVPRLGTLSPWASKATDIARNCGLSVRRIERGIAYRIDGLKENEQGRIAPLLHDRMTESVLASFDEVEGLFRRVEPRPLASVPLARLEQANTELGLALNDEELAYLRAAYQRMGRDPTDAELTMFAQANSEHCRHKIFNADWIVDGEKQPQSLFSMIRHTHAANPQGTISAYADNAAVVEGSSSEEFFPDEKNVYRKRQADTHFVIKCETHNHPTAISPFPGAATGAGGEIRDEGATGRGAKPKAGVVGYSVSHLRIPGAAQPWEAADFGRPGRIAPALQIMLEAPIGAASFNNEFGRPNLAGYFRPFEQALKERSLDGRLYGYHKPIMLAGGVGSISSDSAAKKIFEEKTLLIQLGGPGMLIGMGGGAASSMRSGANTEDLDFDSVQRGNAEIQRRAQEVIDRCRHLGEANPILSIHDVGAGGLSNAMPELVHAAGKGARLDLRAAPSEDSGMSPREIWCNEAQERYVLAIAPSSLARFAEICERERCPFAILGSATADGQLVLEDATFRNKPVDMDLSIVLGKPPKMLRDVRRERPRLDPLSLDGIELREAAYRVLRHPAVADKTFLVSIGDRSVGGLCSRDPFVGPWQAPVADCAVTLRDYEGYAGEAFAVGERTPLALIDGPASGRMAVGEALTNLAAARVESLDRVKLSANWMAAAGSPGEDAALFDTVKAVALELCPALGVSIPVGKDSLSMRTAWDGKEVLAPMSLIVTAFASVSDARATLTPRLRTDAGETELILVDPGEGKQRLGGSILAQVFSRFGNEAPDVDSSSRLKGFFLAIQALSKENLLLAYHDRSDGGLFATICEMAFAGHCGVSVSLDALTFEQWSDEVDGFKRGKEEQLAGRLRERALQAMFSEELGAVLQIRAGDRTKVMEILRSFDLGVHSHVLGTLNERDEIAFTRNAKPVFKEKRVDLQRAWSETTFRMQQLRDNPECAQEEYDRILDVADPGLSFQLNFEIKKTTSKGKTPRVAILREQGVNSQVEMAAAFTRAGFEAVDVHMSDVIAGRVSLEGFRGLAACGGFSYGDVLGGGQGWAKSILFNPRARGEFEAFFRRPDTFALGSCNGCQMMAALKEIIPGAESWPVFTTNRSEQFEARFAMVEVQESASILLAGMAGSRMPIVTAHGEGFALFQNKSSQERANIALRFVDNRGKPTETYPLNPNGSPGGITGLTTPDGRFTVVMPHPERVFRTIQMSWAPDGAGEDSPWMQLFYNARRWVD